LPIPNFRAQAKEHLESILVSHKAKNKVATKNKNKDFRKEKPQIVLTPQVGNCIKKPYMENIAIMNVRKKR
jgi:hypothetical protein